MRCVGPLINRVTALDWGRRRFLVTARTLIRRGTTCLARCFNGGRYSSSGRSLTTIVLDWDLSLW